MTPIKLLSIGLIAATMLAAPAMARENCLGKRHVSESANASASLTGRYTDRDVRIPAPRARALATAPGSEPGGICDFGDNPMIC
jgi:hypothetical protein